MTDDLANASQHADGERATLNHCPEGTIGHRFTPIDTKIEGWGSSETFVVERCERCGNLRLDRRPTLLGEVTR